MLRIVLNALGLLAWAFLAHERVDFWIIAPAALFSLMGLIHAMIKYETGGYK
jgi:hypothetical protein